jgi:integrase
VIGPTKKPKRVIIPTIRVSYVVAGTRTKRWGAFWNEYPYGAGTKPVRESEFFATEAEALAFRAQTLAALVDPTIVPSKNAPPPDVSRVRGFLQMWLEKRITGKSASTLRSYSGFVANYITPVPGDVPIADLNAGQVMDFYMALYDHGVTLANRRHIHAVLSSACTYAKTRGLRLNNPCESQGLSLRQSDEDDVDPEPNPFTAAEAVRVLAWVLEHEPEWYIYYLFLHDTGVRPGELAALKWDDMDLEKALATIRASYSPSLKAAINAKAKATGKPTAGSGESDGEKSTKTRKVRTIDLTTELVERLTTWRQDQRVDSLRRGRKVPVYVVTNRRGSPRRQDGNLRRVLDRVLVGAKITTHHTIYDLRDTFATTHLMQDWNKLPWVSRQLGHASVITTEKHYYKFKPSEVTAAYADQIRARKG